MNKNLFQKIIYVLILISLSSLTLVIFLRPDRGQHVGINKYYKAKFLDMVEGKAYKPFVYRTLLPTTVRVISAITPEHYQKACADLVEQHSSTMVIFDVLEWESQAAFQYLLASCLMLLSFMGFGHCTAILLRRLCNLPETIMVRSLLVTISLMGLPPFFRYTSFIYDPPLLFLFTLALYLLTTQQTKYFFLAFVACCLNKETAILLIPVYGLRFRTSYTSGRQHWYTMAGLFAVYVGIKAALTWVFRDNPGTFVEFQLMYNVAWLTSGWKFTEMVVFLILVTLILFHWNEKPFFLRVSFLMVFLPLLALALFLGLVDEWRGYYEAYPLGLGLAVDSLLQINKILTNRHGEMP